MRVEYSSNNALGCSCCGTPHNFSAYDEEGKMGR